MKCYTIIDSFDDGNEMWTATYQNRSDAEQCLEQLLLHYGMIDECGIVIGIGHTTPSKLFEYLMDTGCSYDYNYGSESGKLFIRDQKIREEFERDVDLPF